MIEGFVQAAGGSLLLAVPVAALAGLLSFLSPCVLPLVPGYLSYVTGLSGADLETARRGRMLAGALLFVTGFAVVFVSSGLLFGGLGAFLDTHYDVLLRVLGVLTIGFGLIFAGVLPWLQSDLRIHAKPAVGLSAAPVLGVTFGLGWTPCMGPTLGVVVTLALSEGTAGRGSLLMFAYALGLGLPFIVMALGYRRMLGALGWVRRHQVWVTRLGGGMMVAVGLLLVTGAWNQIMGVMRQWAGAFETMM